MSAERIKVVQREALAGPICPCCNQLKDYPLGFICLDCMGFGCWVSYTTHAFPAIYQHHPESQENEPPHGGFNL
jgi:hypothetical protein